jgi:hypothetical protein
LNNARELLWTPIGFSLIPVYYMGTSQLIPSFTQQLITQKQKEKEKEKEKENVNILREVYGKIFFETRHIDDSSIFDLINDEEILVRRFNSTQSNNFSLIIIN